VASRTKWKVTCGAHVDDSVSHMDTRHLSPQSPLDRPQAKLCNPLLDRFGPVKVDFERGAGRVVFWFRKQELCITFRRAIAASFLCVYLFFMSWHSYNARGCGAKIRLRRETWKCFLSCMPALASGSARLFYLRQNTLISTKVHAPFLRYNFYNFWIFASRSIWQIDFWIAWVVAADCHLLIGGMFLFLFYLGNEICSIFTNWCFGGIHK